MCHSWLLDINSIKKLYPSLGIGSNHNSLSSLGGFSIMRIVKNTSRYISQDTLDECFESGVVLHVDKVLCGNGFSTTFLKTKPSEGYLNVIIMPNKGAIESKKLDYIKNKAKYNHNRIGFFFAEGDSMSLEGLDVAVFVADSFLKKEAIKGVYIDKLLLDEYHTTEKDSSYRPALKDFMYKVKNIVLNIEDVAITSVTATPNLSSHIDIQIENSYSAPIEIETRIDTEATINDIRNHIANKERVLIFTQNSATIERILKPKHNQFRASATPVNWILGSSLKRGVLELVKYKHDPESNVIICSSKGFEGMDIDTYNDWNVYFFENRSSEYESYLLPNLYQAFHRTRAGHKSLTYCRADRDKHRANTPSGLQKFIDRTDVSSEAKMSTKYSEFHKYVIFNNESREVTMKPNEVAIRLLNDAIEWDISTGNLNRAEGSIKAFCDTRGVTFKLPPVSEKPNSQRYSMTKGDSKAKYLKLNADVIKALDIFGEGYRFNRGKFDSELSARKDLASNLKIVRKDFAKYERRKGYDGTQKRTRQEQIFANLISQERYVNELIKEASKARQKEYKAKYDRAKYEEKMSNAELNMPLFVLRYACDLVNKNVKHKSKSRGHRDFNVTIDGSIDAMRVISDYFEVTFQEVDIVSCNPRIVFNSVGLPLPENVYGVDKVNKKKINILFNCISIDEDKTDRQKRYHRKSKREEFLKLGFPEKVVDHLIDTYSYSKFKGRFYSDMTYNEKTIIDRLKNDLDKAKHTGAVRRHDSVIVYNNKQDLSGLNDTFWYLSHFDWFNVNYIEPEIDRRNMWFRVEKSVFNSLSAQQKHDHFSAYCCVDATFWY